MNPENVRAELEAEWSWRADELRLLRNQLVHVVHESDRDRLRRGLVVMLYAHFEGFCRNALVTYAEAVNAEQLKTKSVRFELAAASLSKVFEALANTDKKNRIFRNSLPTDEKLHRISRQRDFLEQSREFDEMILQLDSAELVDTDSNLKPSVLRKLLFQLGLDCSLCDPWETSLSQLLARRNAIAHGAQKAGISEVDYKGLESAVESLTREISVALFNACSSQQYLRASSGGR